MGRNIFETLHDAVEQLKVMGNKTWFFYHHQMINASDKEVGDDDIGLADNIDLPTDVTGVFEVRCANVDSDDDDDSDERADDFG